jgi:serine/threonine protein kinase
MSNKKNLPRLFGPYELREKIGQGGMGVVYRAKPMHLEHEVAIKIAKKQLPQDPATARRFLNEYTIAFPLQHPNLVRVHACGIEGAVPFLVMEYVAGMSLDKRLNKSVLTEAELLPIFTQVLLGLQHIHERKILHRDLKPGNILLGDDGIAKLADLGLVKDLESEMALTRSRMGLGTYEYAAPEQMDDAKHADARCDLYSLAATMYTALTGHYPFGTGGLLKLLKRKMGNEYTPLRELVPNISPGVEETIEAALLADPVLRPSSCEAFLEGLQGKITFHRPQRASATPSRAERRNGVRRSVHLETTCESLANSAKGSWSVTVIDVSANGICLQAPRRFEPDQMLQVRLQTGEEDEEGSAYVIRIRWVQPLEDNRWMLGCAFVRPLDDGEIDSLCHLAIPKTKMF